MKSVLAKKVVTMLEDSIPALQELGSLTEEALKRLHYFLQFEMKLKKYEVLIKYNCEPKQILISVFDEAGTEYFIKPKDSVLFIKLAEFMDIPDYKVRFMKREDYKEKV